MSVNDKELLNGAIAICMQNGLIPLPKDAASLITENLGLIEAACDGVVRLQPLMSGLLEGKTPSREDLARNYQAMEEIKNFINKKKPIYAELKRLLEDLASKTK